jgi:hypothetical protein
LAWFLKLDTKTGSGSLYSGPGTIDLEGVRFDEAGQLVFHSPPAQGDVVYEFDGSVENNGIRGRIHTHAASEQEGTDSVVNIEFQRVSSTDNTGTGIGDYGSVYSNIEYVAEAGDVVGTELVLLPTPEGLGGCMTVCEGEPAGPYALINAQVSGKTVRFTIQTEDGPEQYQADLSTADVRLTRTDASDSSAEALPRRGTAGDLLVKTDSHGDQ